MPAHSKYAIQLTDEERNARLQEVLLFERMALEESTRQGLESAKRCYVNICYSLGLTPFPVSVDALASYFIHFVKYLRATPLGPSRLCSLTLLEPIGLLVMSG